MFRFDNDKQEENYDQLLLLSSLIDRFEYELVEFKEANNDYDKNKIGQYVSAISNEANLSNQQFGWLIFGVRNKDKAIVGTNYRNNSGLLKLRHEISVGTNGVTFAEVIELQPNVNGNIYRILMFKIPAAPLAIPTSWNGHFYSRNGESLTSLSIDKLDRIRSQLKRDWSREVITNADINMLDSNAIKIARNLYKEKMAKEHIAQEVDEMTDLQFLSKLKLVVDGKITNSAMVLLGNSDYDNLLSAPPIIMWRLYDANGEDKDYKIFKIPFISVIDKIFQNIRNLTYRYMPNQLTLFPIDTQQYDTWLLRELINNCIAHMDYTIGGRIYVDEFDDIIKFSNPGIFLPGEIKPILEPGYNPPFYRNQLLAESMVNLNMIDTATMGIRKVFKIQKSKYFPLPDYDLSNNKVAVTIYGKVINENYTKILYQNPDYDLETIFLIDKVQKKLDLTNDQIKILRKLGIIEGKKPNIFISANVAKDIKKEASYLKNTAFDDRYYKDMILSYLEKFHEASKSDLKELLFDKLPDILSDVQKDSKIRNILQSMRNSELIERDGENNRTSKWILKK